MAVAANDDGLTDYERQRLAHVARNREYMARLGVMDLASKVAPPKTSSTSSKLAPGRKRVKREPTEPSRRSGRLLNAKPEHDGSAVDLLGDEEDGSRRAWTEGARGGRPNRDGPRGRRELLGLRRRSPRGVEAVARGRARAHARAHVRGDRHAERFAQRRGDAGSMEEGSCRSMGRRGTSLF
jgi:hypothetical protein